jgi:hypothetical protein
MGSSMMSTLRRIIAFTALFILVLAPSLRADDAAEAKRRFGEGTKALQEGRYREAALHFEAASRLRPHPVASFTAAVAWDKAEDPTRAADNFARALDLPGLPAKEAGTAKERLASLEESLGTAKLTGPASLTVQFEGSTEGSPPCRLHATPGAHTLVVVRGEKVERRDVILKVGKTVEVDVTEEVAAPPPPSATAPPPPEPKASASAEKDSAPPSKGMPTRKLLGWGMAGVGVVSGIAAIALGAKTMSARDTYVSTPNQSNYDSAVSLRTWTNVCWAGAAVLGGVGIALIVWPESKAKAEAPEKKEDNARLRILPTLGGVQLGGAF